MRHGERTFHAKTKARKRPRGGTMLGELLEEQVVMYAGGEGPTRSREGKVKKCS